MSRDSRPMALGDFLSQMTEYFERVGKSQVKAVKAPEPPPVAKPPAPTAAALAAA